MPLTCPRCLRRLADSADAADRPLFCMFCGQKLLPAGVAPETSSAVLPDPGEPLGDDDTRAFVPADPRFAETADAGSTNPDEPPAEPQVTAVGGYRLLRFIGAGGMGQVYEAEQEETGQRVAVKLLSGRLAANPGSVERFRQEGRVASQITHPHCVFVFRADADAGRPYIVMELMPGDTLKDHVDRRGPLPVGEAVARILDVTDGLAEAHRLGVIHRDVKPSNCFLTADDRVKVGDFGLSKSLAPDAADKQITHSGAFLGTVLFASPEQIRGEPVAYDSDVYSVCGTLYYLLTGRAPYQHESLTAALAKAVSEPPPPIRPRRPDVPRELERVILRGLDRDRDRRWPSLDDLADALRELQPERQQPARPRALAMAFLVDKALLVFTWLVVDLTREVAGFSDWREPLADFWWLNYALVVGYFGLTEGLLGWTVGKRLLRLRVVRVGHTGPPGLKWGLLRAAAFHALWYAPFLLFELTERAIGTAAGGMAFAAAAVTAVVALAMQLRRTGLGWRGLHDLLTWCRVVQRPRPPVRVRLTSRFPNPLDAVKPTPGLPGSVGGFVVKGKVCGLPDGGEVWLAEDRSLGRRVLLRLLPPGREEPECDAPVTRPTRLRVVGHGILVWSGGARAWVGYVAPAGSPLVDVVDPARPLGWAETRPVLDQLAAELVAAHADGTAVEQPTLGQVWVEPNGRVQLLDFPLPTGSDAPAEAAKPADRRSRAGARTDSRVGSPDPLDFFRLAATLALEGKPRAAGGRVKAPLPPHASRITDRLFAGGGRGYEALTQLRAELADTQAQPPRLTTTARAAHLGAQAAMLAFGLLWMFFFAGLFAFTLAVTTAEAIHAPEALTAAVRTPEGREVVLRRAREEADRKWLAKTDAETIEAALAPAAVDKTVRELDAYTARRRLDLDRYRSHLTRPERNVLDRWAAVRDDMETTPETVNVHSAASFLQLAAHGDDGGMRRGRFAQDLVPGFALFVLVWPLLWAGFAFVFRGGLAMQLAGIALVRADGRRAGRFRCAVRELLVWAPVAVLLVGCLWVQAALPGVTAARFGLWLAALLLLPLYVAVALRYLSRPPQDRIMGTHIVPA